MKLPTTELWGIIMSKATDVALTIVCPNRSRVVGYIIKINNYKRILSTLI